MTNGLIDVVRNVRIIWSSGGGLVTNEMNDRVSVENHGGRVFCFTQDAATGSNVVAMTFSAEIITNKSQFQQRLQTIIQRVGSTNFIATSDGRKAIVSKLQKIRLDNFSSTGLPLGEVLRQLAEQSRLRDTNHEGINFLINDHEDNSGVPATTINPLTGMPILVKIIPSSGQPPQTNPVTGIGYNSADVPVTVTAMQDVTLGDALDAIVKGAAKPVHFQIQDYGVQFKAGINPPVLFTRTYTTDTNIFPSNLIQQAVASGFTIPNNSTDFRCVPDVMAA